MANFSKKSALESIQARANRIQQEYKFNLHNGTAQLSSNERLDRVLAYGRLMNLRELYLEFAGETLRIENK